ncbi:MAG TPA: MarR family transcriptional regulator [Ktedonobacterales bacterium]|nr:MarR family transcriptional regulator [Ktedonobacterales bacterium]
MEKRDDSGRGHPRGQLPDGLDERRLAAWRALLTAQATVIEQIERDLAAARQVPLGSYDVLLVLAEAPNRRLRMRELASAVVLNRSTLTRRVDRLEAEGLLVRERCADDRRGAYATLTDAGRIALRAAWPIYAEGIARYFARALTDAEADTLTHALTRIYTPTAPNTP